VRSVSNIFVSPANEYKKVYMKGFQILNEFATRAHPKQENITTKA
jgi:hypothetical protein